jgi:ABC-type transporter Mla subunit MlaD
MKLRLYHRTLIIQHIVTTSAIVFLCVGAFFVGRQAMDTLVAVKQNSNDLHASFEIVNRPRTGTLAGANQVIFGTDALLKQTNGILNHEEKQLSTLDTQERQFFDKFNLLANKTGITIDKIGDTATATSGTLNAATGTLNESTRTIQILNDKDNGIGVTIKNANKTINDVDFFATDEHVRAFVNNLDPLSKNVVTVTGNLGDMTGDFKTKFHTWLYPVPCTTWQCKVGKIVEFAGDAGKFAEPAYFVEQMIQSWKK